MGEAEEGASAVYDVFINHRGPDTKRTVASLIYRRIIKYGLRIFLDQDELEAGDPLYDKIKSAISSSSVHVAIFSVRYAESSWCLNELSDMLQSGCKVIPIFYGVKPVDLRHIMKGCYAEAFRNHQNNGRHDMELVERWKDALLQASTISGVEFDTEEDDLGDLVDEIVEKVLKEAKWKLLYVAEHPVGLQQAAEDFNKFLKERQLSATTIVGIIGLAGSGKSTLVRHLYNCNLESREFKRYCFLSELNKKDLAVLQQKVVRDLLGDDKYSISDTANGKRSLRTCLRGCGPVLIVLDGLDKEEQIESLLLVVKKDVLAEGSLILVTCHDKALLEAHQVNLFYQVKLLQGKDAHDLFCWYAFDKPKPPQHLEDFVPKFLEICCGFPLAMKVLGRKLSVEQDRRDWEEQLKDLSRAKFPISIVEEILKVSYNYLEQEKKEVFLDVAHFLVGEDTDLAVRVLEGLHDTSGLMCLKALQRKCLLDLEEIEHCKRAFAKGPGIQWRTKAGSKIRMHDLIRKMARQIAIEDSRSSLPTKPLRFCQLNTISILQLLEYTGNHVRGIRSEDMDEPGLQYQYINELQLHGQSRAELYGLRLLVIQDYGCRFPFHRLSGDLIWLRMRRSRWGNTIPPTLLLRNLRVLELDGVQLEALGRMDSDEFPSKLCELTVDYNGMSAENPRRNQFGKNSMEASSSARGSVWDWFRVRELTDLVKLVLKNVRGLNSLPIDFGALRNLRHLDLSGCSDLKKMPESFTGLLQLQYLALQNCMSLSISYLGGITKLEYLDFEGCSLLQKLPDKTTAQRGLKYLNLMGTSIEELPQDFGELKILEQLLISSSYLRTLPGSFHELGQLRILTLSECPRLKDISSSISIKHFPYLESLQLWDVGVRTVPQGIAWSSVKRLRVKAPLVNKFSFERDQSKLPLDRSHSQGSFQDRTRSVKASNHNLVSSLTELRLVETGIFKLWIPPEESLFPNLEIVDLSDNPSLTEVESLPCNLRSLYLNNCLSLTTLPCLSNLAYIRILDISGCRKLEALNLEGLRSIKEIAAKDCRELQSIQGLVNLACMRILDISGCHNLKALNLEGLRSIEEIKALECWNLQSMQGLAQLRTLSSLNFSTFHVDINSTLWSEILGFPSNVSTAILGGANVLRMNAGDMDCVQQSISADFEGATIIDITNLHRVQLKDMELYGAILFCFIAKKHFIKLHFLNNNEVHFIGIRPSFVTRKEISCLYTFLWSQNSNLFKHLTFHGESVLDFTVECIHGGDNLNKAWITMIRNETDGVKMCKQLLNSLCGIPKQAVHQAAAL